MEKRLSVFSSRKKKEEKKQHELEIQLRQACLEEPPSLEKIRPIVAQYPASVLKAKNEDGERPLHLACWKGASLEVVQFLVRCWPNGVRAKTNRQWIPLHYACFAQSSSLKVIEYLVETWPESVQQVDNRNRCPLHLACFSATPLPTIQYLVKQWPNSIQQQDNGGSLPLHLACDNKASPLEVITWLVTTWPNSIQTPNHYASLALHRACFSLATLQVVDYLLQQYPKACQATTQDGDLPLHLAAGSGASLEVVQHVARVYPKAVFSKNKEQKTPLDMALQPFTFYKPTPQVVNWLEMVTSGKFIIEQDKETSTTTMNTIPTNSTKMISTSHSLQPPQPHVDTTTKRQTRTTTVPVPVQQQQQHHRREKAFEKERDKLLQVLEGKRDKPVCVSSKYPEFIQKEEIGKGWFGTVYKGVDHVLQQTFAIKCVEKNLIDKEAMEQCKNEFQKEQCALLLYRHANIALLYGYCMSESSRKTLYYLLYQFGEKGSLDFFWKSPLGRERLSYFPRRVHIALDAWIGLRFLHVGNRHVKPSCHGDVKSANIVLQRDWTAQLIDVGLSTLMHSSNHNNNNNNNSTMMVSAGVKGTRGYVCPKYCTGSIAFQPACDVFSFGVVLAELWSGTLQNHVDGKGRIYNFLEQYLDEDDEPRHMEEDLDPTLGYGVSEELPDYMYDYRDLALDCMARNLEKRPSGEAVMNRLEKIWQVCRHVVDEEESVFEGDRTIADEEAFSESLQSVANLGGADPSACRLCRTYATEVGFEKCPLCIALQQQRLRIAVAVSSKLDAHSVALASRTFHAMRAENRSLQNIRQEQRDSSLPVLSRLDLRLNNPIPRLFFVVPANLRDGWKHPKAWLRRRVATKYHLYFVCGQTYQAMKPPIKFTASQEWMDKIALSLGVSLTLLQIAARKGFEMNMKLGGVGKAPLVVGPKELSEMLTEVKHVLDEGDHFDVLGRIRSGTRLSDKDIQALNGETYELIVERAREDRGWRIVMSPARKGGESNILWVCNAATEDSRNEYEAIVV